MKDLKIFIFILFVILSFFLGYFYKDRECDLKKQNKEKKQVNIEIMKTKLKITKNSPDIEVFINGENHLTGSIDILK